MNTDKPRCGVLAVPESYQKRGSIQAAKKSLKEHFKGEDVGVGIGTGETLVLMIFTTKKIDIPDTWQGYKIEIRDFAGPLFPRDVT